MSRHGPDFDDLIGADPSPGDRERLRRAHELLKQAGPPPELPASLLHAPGPGVHPLPQPPARRRPRRALLAAVAAALVLVGVGVAYLAGGFGTHASRLTSLEELHGTAAAPLAHATVNLGSRDRAGNWPLRLSVAGLAPLPPGDAYEMYATKNGKPVASCGTFKVGAGTTVVRLNTPYERDEYTGWIVVRRYANRPAGPALLTTDAVG